ncbi:diguanylate cyclase/phosphodiesterase (GGDEF & EAL domains) with PAS/PAC sensor(s) [hydrothermal vent metagenome]|uniref:Diguanylate cyclase/phosphodiesterase (GGDEF & EAL domains) with PAS/PAC sensor(S) n=1 Tax=hydrothermal vent metagenome TaxID=652676 RepID=A0A3B0W4P0_9ZZZZ
MLLEIAGGLVVTGLLLLIVGIFIARQYTLRAKLVTAIMVIVLASLAVLAILDGYTMGQNLSEGADKALTAAARNYASRIDLFNQQNAQYLRIEASLPAINHFITRKAAPPYNRQALLEILLALKSRQKNIIYSYAILNKQGVNILDTDSANIGVDESHNKYFSVLTGRGRLSTYRSPIIFEQQQPVIIFSSAINDLSGKLIGVLRTKYDASILTTLFDRTKGMVGRGSFAVLLDENNMRLVHGRRNDLNYTLASIIEKPRLQKLKKENRVPQKATVTFVESDEWVKKVQSTSFSKPNVEMQFSGLGTVLFSAAVVRLETAPWTIIVSQPQDVFLEPVIAQMQRAFFLVTIIVIVVVLIVMAATKLLLGPVKRLTGVVRAIADGDLRAQANVEADDEIGGLANAFNDMTQNINTLIVDLESEVGSHKLTAENLNKLSQAIEQSPISVMITDLSGSIEYVNPQLCKVTGYKEEELKGQNPRILKSGKTPEIQFKNMWSAVTTGHSWTGELYNKKKNGDLFWENVTVSPIKNSENKSTHYLAIKEDISLRKDYEERLLYQASYDKLTDLPNRTLAYDRIQQAIANAIREQKHIALLYMDFDHFKNINDTLGHGAGDEFLKYMAGRLKSCVRDFDTVARLGGDEFLIMLVDTDAESAADKTFFESAVKRKTEEILRHISQPCVIHDMEFSVTASVGIAIFPQDGDDPHILLRNADTAMYRSKRKGRDTYQVFTPEMGDVVMKRVEIDSKLRHALEDDDFYLKYQPLMDAKYGVVIGAEALIRWDDAQLGEVSPEEFVPLAEESGLIVEIGNWVFDTALAAVKKWREDPAYKDFYIAINLSSRQFRGKDIVKTIADYLNKYDLPGESLELEITERLLMKDVPHVVSILNQFKEMNIRLSIDDFGTGYSSLSYLKRFPFDILKIDKAFISDIGEDPDDTALCDAIIAMAHSLGLSIIGEGVENKVQFDFLHKRGVEIIQGYYVSEPLVADTFVEFINTSRDLKPQLKITT